ncbi:MAG: TonB-dependent receptor, partial [Alphaproteobacteria bacterium]
MARVLVLGSVAILPAQVAAQQAQTGERTATFEEIIVTGEKRERNLQEVPLAISAVTGETADRFNVRSVTDLTGFAPSLLVTREEGFERAVTIRGLGKANTQSGISQSVAIHQDGIFFPSTLSLNADLLDIDRIEVLRGPQGTVFGQNAIGGVVNIITNQPKLGEWEGQADVAVGTDSLFQARGVVNAPLGETLAIRVTAQQFQQDGFTKNLLNGQELDENDNISARVQLLWAPTETLEITARYQIFDTDVNGRALKSIFDPTPNPRILQQDFPSFFAYNSDVASLNVEWDQPFFTAKFIGSYQDDGVINQLDLDRGATSFTNFLNPSDTTGAATGIVTDDRIIRNNVFREIWTAELNIVSNEKSSFGGVVDWIVGGFYSNEDRFVSFLELGDFNFDGMVMTEDQLDKSNPFSNPDLGFATDTNVTDETWSVYGQATFHVTDYLRVTGGVRYTEADIFSDALNF